MFLRFRHAALLLTVVAAVAAVAFAAATAPAFAYGKANWQVTFSGTGIYPGTATGFGFWGWCDFAGDVSYGTSGDCEESQYVHGSGGFTCEASFDLSGWYVGLDGDFIYSGTVTVNPTRLTAPCVAFFPGSTLFTDVDSGIPAAPGHYNIGVGALGAPAGEFNITVAQIP